MPTQQTDSKACTWQWLENEVAPAAGGTAVRFGLWAEDCKLATGRWHIRWEAELPGYSLWVDDTRQTIVAQLFTLPQGQAISALLPELRRRALIADTADCVFQPAAIRPAPRTIAFFEVKPVGEALKAFESTPDDEVPEPPCGDYGWSTHGVRYFRTDLRQPGFAVYLDEGQDGTMMDPTSVSVLR